MCLPVLSGPHNKCFVSRKKRSLLWFSSPFLLQKIRILSRERLLTNRIGEEVICGCVHASVPVHTKRT